MVVTNNKNNKNITVVKNCDGPEISPLVSLNKLACHSLTDLGKRHSTPGAEIKNLITYSISSSQSNRIFLCQFLKPQHPQGDSKKVR